MASLEAEARKRYERNWTNRLARNLLDPVSRDRWQAFGSISRTHAHRHKKYVIWTLADDESANVVEVLQMVDTGLSLVEGLSITFQRRDGERHKITSTPSRPFGLDVFFWLPAFNEVRWSPVEWDDASTPRLLRIAVGFKQLRHIGNGPVPDCQYMSEMGDFARQFPEANF